MDINYDDGIWGSYLGVIFGVLLPLFSQCSSTFSPISTMLGPEPTRSKAVHHDQLIILISVMSMLNDLGGHFCINSISAF